MLCRKIQFRPGRLQDQVPGADRRRHRFDLDQAGRARRGRQGHLPARALRDRAAAQGRRSPTATSPTSTRSPTPSSAAGKRLGSRNRNVALALPAAMVITKKIIVPSGQKEEELELTGRGRGQPVHPLRARRGQPRLPDPRPGAEQSRRGRGPDRRLPQGEGRGPRRDRRGRGPEAAGDGRRVLRDAGGVRAHRAVAARERARPEHRAGRHRRPRDALLRAAQQPVPVLPRPGVRRQPADAGHPAGVQPVAGRSRVGEEEPGPARRTTTATCCSRSWKRSRSRSPARCSSSSRRRRTTRSTRSCWPAAARCCPASTSSSPSAPASRRSSPTRSPTWQTSDRIRPRQLAQDAPMLLIACGLALRSFE